VSKQQLNLINSIKLFQQRDIPKLPTFASFPAVVAADGRPLAQSAAVFHFPSRETLRSHWPCHSHLSLNLFAHFVFLIHVAPSVSSA
jgi:hypothetical protein